MLLFLSLIMFVIGIEELRKERKVTGWFSITAFLF
ncbi:DUF3953 domain-containing protein [Bacillus infantis]